MAGEAPAGHVTHDASDPVQALLAQTMALALECHRSKNLAQAEELYRAVLSLAPGHADANHNLGAIAVDCGQFLAAVPFFQAALQANPKNRQYWVSLVDALMQAGEYTLAEDILEDARRGGLSGDAAGELAQRLSDAAIRRARSARPPQGRMAPAQQCDEIRRLFEAEKFEDVVRLGRKMLRQYPQCPMGFKSLGAALMQLGQNGKAIEPMRQALQLNPRDVDLLSNFGLARSQLGDLVQAEVLLRQAVGHAPDFKEAWFNLAMVLRQQARLPASEAAYRSALAVGGDDPKVWLNLGLLLGEMHRFTEAQTYARKALELDPNMVRAHVGLGMLLKDQGRLPEALKSLQRALELNPADQAVQSSYLFVANCMPEMDPLERFAAYQRFNRYFGEPHHRLWSPHTNDRNPERRLRVGYVAPVFRTHACRPFLEPLLENHDRQRVELFAYSGPFELEDDVTDHYRTLFEHWIDTRQMSDDELAARIRADGIDILVDIAGQTRGHRLGAFARKPAPVSLHWLDSGYTTGLTAIDYYLTDAMTVPVGSEHLFSETPWRLPRSPFAYRPSPRAGEVSELPALHNGYVTFGTLTRAVRLNDGVVRAWADLLHRVPGSKLEINSGNFSQAEVCEQWLPRFGALGITRDRVIMGYESPPWNVLRRVDIALDCFPQNSGTTLIESLYMGLPFVSLAGVPSMGTLGASVLSAVGHPEWIARSEAEYVDKLVALASDLPRLAQIRSGLRAQMQSSALMDEAGFARDVEDAYQQMFARWCATRG